MLVSKREVRKTSKKLLSVLLAVMMIMTSISVCFGSISFAAGQDVSVTALANALKFDSIKNATFSGAANNYTVSDPDGKVLAAVEAYFAVVDAMANKNPAVQTPSTGTSDIAQKGESSDKTYRTINHLNARVKTLLSSEMGSDYTTYKVDAFLTGLLAGSTVSEGTTKVEGTASETNNTKVPGTPLSAAPAVKLTVMMESAITGYTLDNLPDSVVTSKTFTVTHNNNKYDYAYDYTAESTTGSGCNATTVPAKYKHDYWFYYNYAAYSVTDGAAQSTEIIKNAQTTLEKNEVYFSMTMDDLYATAADTLTTVSTEVAAAKKAVVDGFGGGVFTHFFSAYAVDTLVNDIATAKEVQIIAPKLLKAYEDMEKGYADIITDKGALTTLAATMKTAIDAYNAASAAARAYCTTKGFIVADVTAFRTAVLREIELIELRAAIAAAWSDICVYAGYSTDGIADGSVTSTMIGAAITTMAGHKTALDGYNSADLKTEAQKITGEDDFATTINEINAALSNLKKIAGYEDRFSAEYATFAAEIFSVTDKDGDIGTLISALKKYDSWYTGLKSLVAEMESVLGKEIADKLFDNLNNVMVERMDDAYVALNALLEGQIDYAYDLFKAFIAGDNDVITMANVSTYNKMKGSIGLINTEAYNYLKDETAHFKLSQEAIDKYNEMQREFPQYEEFLKTHGFSSYVQTTMPDLERPDTEKDIARENENGVYKTSDADIEKIIGNLDALLQNDQIKSILGTLINKDKETGEPTGEAFDLANLITGLLDGIYTDSLINTIVQYVYPIVCKEFAKVWAGIDTKIDMTVEDVEVLGSKKDVPVTADLSLYTVEDAIAAVGVYLAPSTLATNLQNNYSKYTQVINVLKSATTKAVYNKNGEGDEDDTFVNPWEDSNLFENVYDEETGEQLFNDDGTPKQVYKLKWGVDEAAPENKRAAFIDAACAALSGIEPLLLGILTNKTQANANDSDSIPRGHKIGTGYGTAQVKIVINLTLELTIDPITLVLSFGGNDGWDNALAPIFEALGIPASEIPHGESMNSTRDILNNLFGMIDKIIAKVAEAPVTFILNALPNLAYALEGGLVKPILGMLKTEINYYADAYYSVNAYLTTVTGGMDKAMKSEEPILINLGDMINLDDMGLDVSSFQAIWNMITGGIELLKGIDAPNAGKLATMGELVPQKTNRSDRTYSVTSVGGKTLAADEAWHVKANKADVLLYLLEWVLNSGLLGKFELPAEGIVADIIASLNENPDIILAAVVELLSQKEYDTLREFDWFNGVINDESVVGNSAYEEYLNPNNDWTKEKAEYLYEHIDTIVGAIVSLAGLDFDIHALLEESVGGIFTNETVTALAKLLGKLGDINALIAGDSAETETETPDSPETVAEGEEEATAPAIDVAALLKEFLGLDFSSYAQYANIGEDEVIDFGVENADTFVDALVELLKPLKPVLDFILAGKNLDITLSASNKVTLIGYNGYNNAIVPLLEALGCDIAALGADDNALEVVLDALVSKVGLLTNSLTPIKEIVDLLPGVFYYIASKGLSVTVRNLLQPVYVILDTIRPVLDLDLNALINDLLPEDFGIMLNIDDIGLDFIFDLLKKFVPELDLSAAKDLIYDICLEAATEYDSASDLQDTWMKGAYSEDFDQADLLTVVLSFLLDWATEEDNAAALDEMLGTDIISSLGTVFGDMEISYETPVWYYWFDTEEKFNDYIAGGTDLPNTLTMLTYPNDWSDESADYIAANIADLVDMVIALINKDKEDGAKSVSELLTGLVNGLLSADVINDLIGSIKELLATVDSNLIEAAGLLLGVDLIGLSNYECTAEINSISDFIGEISNVLTTYASGLVNLLFFGDDYRFFAKPGEDAVTDEIVINGGLGYEKGLALLLEVLGAEVPDPKTATVETVLGSLAARVEAILADPVNEALDILPNLVYFLNANGATVVVNNILAPVFALLEKLTAFGVELDLAGLLGFDIKHLRLDEIFALVESKTGLKLDAAEEILSGLCFGKIEKADYTYRMVAERGDVVTVLITTALILVSDDEFAAKLDEMLGTEIISAIDEVFGSAPVTYKTPDWYALDENDIDYDNATIGVIKSAIEYPNNWTEDAAKYITDNLGSIGNVVAGMIDSDYATLGELINDKVNIYTPDLLASIQKVLADLIGGLDEDLAELVNIGLGAADALLSADVQGLLDYDVSGVSDKESFVAALTGMLMEVEGLIDWLLLGEDYTFFVNEDESDIITINGGHGYAEGLALVLEALGVEGLPEVYGVEKIDTEAVVKAVLTATFDRVDAILADPVNEVFNILPNVIYFINSNGVTVAIDNLLGAVNALLIKLEGFGLEVNIAELVNFSDILGVETEFALDNMSMEAIIALVAELTGLNLDKIADVLIGFALGRVAAYESVSSADITAMMYYHDDFAKYDMVTVLATLAIITLTDGENAAKIKEMLGEDIYTLICNLCNMEEEGVQAFDWQFTDKADTDYVFSALSDSEIFEEYKYGTLYTKEKAQYIADNFGDFVDDVLYLLGLEINGIPVNNLKQFLNDLLDGSLYNSSNVVAIRDALAGVLEAITKLEVNGAVVGGLIADVLAAADVAYLNDVANVEIAEFTNDREAFVAALCDVLEPLYPVLKYLLADEDFSFFVNIEGEDAITLKGAEGYRYGIIPVLETLECQDIMAPEAYYAAVAADGDVLLTSILNPLLNRVDELLGEDADPAQEILDMLPNLIYFINSNGVDTVVKNTLNAVYTVLAAIAPVAEIDLYNIIGIDLAEINFEWLFSKLLEIIKDATGYEFADLGADAIAELTVGKLVSYDSLSGETAYKMVYDEGESGDKAEMVTVIERLILEFIMHENNREMVIGLLKDYLGMDGTAEEVIRAILQSIADVTLETSLGQDTALATIYYVFYGVDLGVDFAATGMKDLNAEWTKLLKDMKNSDDIGESTAGTIITTILGWEIFEDIIDPELGIAPNGIIKFIQKIIEYFKAIVQWFENLYK